MARIIVLFPALFALLELAVLIKVGELIGTLPVLALVLAGVVIGAAFMKRGGLSALRRARETMARGDAPVGELFDLACVALAGLLFMFPGFISDVLALPLVVPQTRRWLRGWLAGRLHVRQASPSVIEGEWHRVEDDAPRLPR